jgi:hypothetical protein
MGKKASSNKNDKKKIEKEEVFKLFHDYINSSESSIQKKDMSIWLAAVLYIGVYWTVFSFIIAEGVPLLSWVFWVCLTSSTIFTFLMLFFVYSQFNSLIDSITVRDTLRIGVCRLATKDCKILSFSDLKYPTEKNKTRLPEILLEDYDTQVNLVDRYRGKQRPIKVIGYSILTMLCFPFILVMYLIYYLSFKKWFKKTFSKDNSKESWWKKLRATTGYGYERQEGAIYLIMIFLWLGFILFIIMNIKKS